MGFLNRFFGSQAADSIRRGDAPTASSSFRCVQINANGAGSCEAARALRGKRFLPDEIPSLPLEGCTAESCDCSYELFSDRRRVPRNSPVQQGAVDETRRPDSAA